MNKVYLSWIYCFLLYVHYIQFLVNLPGPPFQLSPLHMRCWKKVLKLDVRGEGVLFGLSILLISLFWALIVSDKVHFPSFLQSVTLLRWEQPAASVHKFSFNRKYEYVIKSRSCIVKYTIKKRLIIYSLSDFKSDGHQRSVVVFRLA